MKIAILNNHPRFHSAWVVRGEVGPNLYMDCFRVPLSEHDYNSDQALAKAKQLAQPLADAPCNKHKEIVIVAVGL